MIVLHFAYRRVNYLTCFIFEKEELIKDKHHYRYRVANFKLT